MKLGVFARAGLLSVLLWSACGGDTRIIERDAGACDVDADSVSVAIGVKGGVVKASGVTLVVPEGALDKEVVISAKRVLPGKEVGATKAQLISDVYEFGPEGTKFKKDVDVAFKVADGAPKAAVYFTKESSKSFEKLPSDAKDGEVHAKVKHFSQGFAGLPAAETSDAGEDGGAPADAGDGSKTDGGTQADGGADAGLVSPARRVLVRSRDNYGIDVNQTWAALQDGSGDFQRLATPSLEGLYELEVHSDRFALAFVCATADNARASLQLVYATAEQAALDVVSTSSDCQRGQAPATFNASGGLILPGGASYYWFGYSFYSGTAQVPVGANNPVFSFSGFPYNQPVDIVMGAATSANTGLTRVLFQRDVTSYGADVTGLNADFIKTGYDVGAGTFTVSGASGKTVADVRYAPNGGLPGMTMLQSTTSSLPTLTVSFATIPETPRRASDRYVFSAEESDGLGGFRRAEYATYATGDRSLALPAAFAPAFSWEGQDPAVDFQAYPNATSYAFLWNYRKGGRSAQITMAPAWLDQGGPFHFVFPDLTAVDGFDASWGTPALGASEVLSISGEARSDTSDASGALRIRALVSGTLQGQ